MGSEQGTRILESHSEGGLCCPVRRETGMPTERVKNKRDTAISSVAIQDIASAATEDINKSVAGACVFITAYVMNIPC